MLLLSLAAGLTLHLAPQTARPAALERDLTSVFQALDFSQMPGGSLMPRVPVLSPHVNGLIEYMDQKFFIR